RRWRARCASPCRPTRCRTTSPAPSASASTTTGPSRSTWRSSWAGWTSWRSGAGSTRGSAQHAPHDRPRRRAAQHFLEAAVRGGRQPADIELAGAELALRVERIRFHARRALRAREVGGAVDQLAHQPPAAETLGDDEAGDRPHRRLVDRREMARARQPRMLAARRDGAPAGRLAVDIGEHTQRARRALHLSQEPALVAFAPARVELAARTRPEGAPAVAGVAAIVHHRGAGPA